MQELVFLSKEEKKKQALQIIKEYEHLLVPKTLSKKEFEVVSDILKNKKISKVFNNYLNASIKYKLAGAELITKLKIPELLFKKDIEFIIEEIKEDIYLNNVTDISNEKILIIKGIFDFLKKFNFIKAYFIIGSYITKEKFNDIDIVLFIKEDIIEEDPRAFIGFIMDYLKDRFNLDFHINIFGNKEFFDLDSNLLLYSLINHSIGNKKISVYPDIEKVEFPIFNSIFTDSYLGIDKGEYSVYLSDLKSLIVYRLFLEKKELSPSNIETGLIDDFGNAFFKLKNNKELTKKELLNLRTQFIKDYRLIFGLLYDSIKNKQRLLDYVKDNILEFKKIYKKQKDKNSYANFILYEEVLKEIEKLY